MIIPNINGKMPKMATKPPTSDKVLSTINLWYSAGFHRALLHLSACQHLRVRKEDSEVVLPNSRARHWMPSSKMSVWVKLAETTWGQQEKWRDHKPKTVWESEHEMHAETINGINAYWSIFSGNLVFTCFSWGTPWASARSDLLDFHIGWGRISVWYLEVWYLSTSNK